MNPKIKDVCEYAKKQPIGLLAARKINRKGKEEPRNDKNGRRHVV